jgi:LEA14-like dessication related protein
VAAVLLAGCAGLQGVLKDPDLHLDRVVVRSLSPAGGTLDLVVSFYNPNQFDLHGTRLRMGLDVEQSHVGDLEYTNDFQLQKGDTTTLTLPLGFFWSGIAGAARTALGSGELPYTLRGQLTVGTPFGDHEVAFSHQGRAPLSRVAGLLPVPAGR